jgi:two-component system LytT family response regulator
MPNEIQYICIDDDFLSSLLLIEYAKKNSNFEHLGNFTHPILGLQKINEINPQLLFIDIDMPELNGIELVKQIKNKDIIVVFITSHAEFALEGFQLQAFDYILKPLNQEKFDVLASRIIDFWNIKKKAEFYDILIEENSIIIKEGHARIKLSTHDIIYLEALQDYTKIITQNKSYLTLTTFTSLIDRLPIQQFMRVHRSYAVALNKVKQLKNNEIICGDFTIPIGKTYRSNVAQLNL